MFHGSGDRRPPLFPNKPIGAGLFLIANLTDPEDRDAGTVSAVVETKYRLQAVIEGHADEQARDTTFALASRAMRRIFALIGDASSRLRVVSYGKETPVEICSNEAANAKETSAVDVTCGSER